MSRPPASGIEDLALRPLEADDAVAMVEAVNSSLERLRPWMVWAASPATLDDTARRLALSRVAMASGGDGSWGLFMPDGAAGEVLVGAVGLHDRIGDGGRDVGYWLRTGWTGRGLATAAAARVVRRGFEEYDLRWVEIRCDAANEASAGIARRLGFRLVACVEEVAAAPKETGETLVWELRREEWAASSAASLAAAAAP